MWRLGPTARFVFMFIICLWPLICQIVFIAATHSGMDSMHAITCWGTIIRWILSIVSDFIWNFIFGWIWYWICIQSCLGQLSLYFGSATVLFWAFISATGNGRGRGRGNGNNKLMPWQTWIYFGHAAFCYTISIKATTAVGRGTWKTR